MSQSLIDWLSEWYRMQCNDEWEHSYGVTIETIDNPGWSVKIDLKETPFEVEPFENASWNVDDDHDWWACQKEGSTFIGYCGPLQLSEVLKIFREWVEKMEAR